MGTTPTTPPPAAPRVSALVLSYNNQAGLRRTLEALEASTIRAAMEVLVMENGSTDGSVALDVEFPSVTFMRLPRNFGATKALNIGMRTAAAEYFFYLSTEVEVAPEAAGKLADYLDSHEDAAAVCPLVTDAGGAIRGDYFKIPAADTLKGAWREAGGLPRAAISGGEPQPIEYAGRSALMARKFFVRGLNYFDERFGEFGADLDLAFQIRRAGRKTVLVPEARATLNPGPGLPAAAAGTLRADRANGVAVFLAKHYGAFASAGFKIGAALGELVRLQMGTVAAIAGGSKIDGSQSDL